MIQSSLPLFLIGAWLLAVVLIGPYIIAQARRKKNLSSKIKNEIEVIDKFLGVYESRLQIVRSHAIDYLNSLGSEGARIMSEIQTEAGKVKLIRDHVQKLLSKKTVSSLKKAESIIDGESSVILEQSNSNEASQKGNKANEYALDLNWQRKLEQMLQDLGNNVASASNTAKKAGVPAFSRQEKRETIHDLKEAGIDISKILGKK